MKFGSSPSPAHDGDGHQARVLFNVDRERRLVIAKFGECLTATDIQSYVRRLRAHPGFDRSFSEIADISEVKELPLDVADLLKLADRIDPFSIDSKRAFVVRTSQQKHAAVMHKMLRNLRHCEIFQTLDEARDWVRR